MLITGSTGAIGLAGVQICKKIGAKVIALGSDMKKTGRLDIVKQMGADHIINYVENPTWKDEVKQITGGKGAHCAAAVITMAAAPFLTNIVPQLCDWLGQSSWFGGMFHDSPPEEDIALSDHVIIAGFGINGRSLATALAEFGVPHVILELNPETVRSEGALGIDIRYGDCTRRPILEHAGIFRARAFVVAISDPASARRSVRVARDLVPELEIFVRTEFLQKFSGSIFFFKKLEFWRS